VAYTTSISGRQRSLIEFFADDTVLAGKILSKDFRFGIDDDVDVALAMQRDILRAMVRHGREAHCFE
jgi:hypothetical protein